MAFTTTRGESGVDFIGTDGVDALFVINEPENNVVSGGTGVITIDAKAGNDNVDLTNESGVTGNAEVKLGEGNDILTMGGNAVNRLNRLVDSFVNGGPGNDDITTEGTVSTKLRGNEGDDDFFLNSNYTGTTINGNSGQDSITLDGDITLSDTKILGGSGNDGQFDFSDTGNEILAVDSVIQGGKGLDTITIGDVTTGTTNFRVSGGADNDTILVQNTNEASDGVAYNGAAG
ncbi:MAG: hypothetical protein GY902_03415, partial [Planctomycetes bacterium]|nr:hypothetical protein [Planctomycetota bacterium]